MDVSGVEAAVAAVVGLCFLLRLGGALLDWWEYRQAFHVSDGIDSASIVEEPR
ncbi:MAG: hypothetical protein ACRDSQ_28300 [Actinokineospora sp.]